MTHRSLFLCLLFILFTIVSDRAQATTTENTQNSANSEALSVVQAQDQSAQGPNLGQESATTLTLTTPRSTTLRSAQNALQIFLQETRHYRTLMAQTQDVHIKSCTIPLALLHRIEADVSCAICREEFAVQPEDPTQALITLSNAQDEAQCCPHMFHTACLKNWFASQEEAGNNLSCPMCRSAESFRQPLHNYRVIADEPAGVVTVDRELMQAAVTDLVNRISWIVERNVLAAGITIVAHHATNSSFMFIREALERYLSLNISPEQLILLTTFLPIYLLIDILSYDEAPGERTAVRFLKYLYSAWIYSMIPPTLQVLIPQILLQGRIIPFSWQGTFVAAGAVNLPLIIRNARRIMSLMRSPEAQVLRRNFSTLSIGQATTSAFAQRIVTRAQQGAAFIRDTSVAGAQGLYNVTQRGLGALSTRVQQGAQSFWGRVSNNVGSVFHRFAPA